MPDLTRAQKIEGLKEVIENVTWHRDNNPREGLRRYAERRLPELQAALDRKESA